MYNINFDIVTKHLTPPKKWGVKHLAWLRAIAAPLQSLNTSFFVDYFGTLRRNAKRTGQKIVLENTLNEEFTAGTNYRIYINNATQNRKPIYFYNTYARSVYFNTQYFYTSEEIGKNSEFIVYVPAPVFNSYPENVIKAEVDKYRPVGTKFQIVSI